MTDVPGDGTNNNGRAAAVAKNKVMPVVRREPDIACCNPRRGITGDTAFPTIASNVSSFHTAVPERFFTEIALVGAQNRSG
jgi:hypothetical protein